MGGHPSQPVTRIGVLRRGWDERVLPFLVFSLLFLMAVLLAQPAQANPKYGAIVVDAVTGEVLHESRGDRRLYPASTTKIMTLYLTFQALEDDRLSLDDQIPISANAAAEVPTKLGLPAGSTIRVEDAIYALVTKSANDISTALAEAIGGSEANFARMMTDQARELGMSNTTFRNAHGLPDEEQVTTVRDMATLARAMLRNFPEHYHYFGTERWTYRGTSYRNHNRLMSSYEGMDGFKTGYTRASGFNLVASAVRGNLRLIAVVFGGRTSASRNEEVADLLDAAFASDRGEYLIAHGGARFLPFDPPLPPSRPGISGPIVVAGAAPFAGSALEVPALPPQLVGTPIPPAPPAPIAVRDDIELVAVSANTAAGSLGVGIGGDLPDIGEWGIQVGAFTDTTAGNRAVAMATSTAPDLLGGAETRLMEIYTEYGRLYRARLVGLSQDAAILACDRLITAGGDCLTIAPGEG